MNNTAKKDFRWERERNKFVAELLRPKNARTFDEFIHSHAFRTCGLRIPEKMLRALEAEAPRIRAQVPLLRCYYANGGSYAREKTMLRLWHEFLKWKLANT